MPLSSRHLPLRTDEAYHAAAAVLIGALVVILAALAFEHVGGLVPCPLCYQQRWAYYAGIPVTFLAMVALAAGRRRVGAVLLGLVGAAFLANAGFAGYHAGVEWGFWQGPATCSAGGELATSARSMLSDLADKPPVLCDRASWRLFGLSFAGWNVVACLGLAAIAVRSATLAPR
jgi:disulfide bond formation protein DsbB